MRSVEVAAVRDSDEVTSNYHKTYFSREERQHIIAREKKQRVEPAQQA